MTVGNTCRGRSKRHFGDMPIACFRNFQAGGSHPAGRRHRGSPVDGAEEFLRFEAQELLEDTPQVVYSPSGVILEAVGFADYFGATIFGEGYLAPGKEPPPPRASPCLHKTCFHILQHTWILLFQTDSLVTFGCRKQSFASVRRQGGA